MVVVTQITCKTDKSQLILLYVNFKNKFFKLNRTPNAIYFIAVCVDLSQLPVCSKGFCDLKTK